MISMKRTKSILVRIDEDTYEELKLRARGSGRSMAGLVREATAVYLHGGVLRSSDSLFSLEGQVNSGRKDGGRRHDKYIYGRDRG